MFGYNNGRVYVQQSGFILYYSVHVFGYNNGRVCVQQSGLILYYSVHVFGYNNMASIYVHVQRNAFTGETIQGYQPWSVPRLGHAYQQLLWHVMCIAIHVAAWPDN